MNTLRMLPIGIQTFEKIREDNYIYVDKTALVHQLVRTSIPYFLSRPRRFGKSLLLSTIKAYFEGKKELFEGLAIEKLETDWEKYPVLHLDLNAEKYESPERLSILIESYLAQWEAEYERNEDENSLATRFAGVIRRAYEKTGKRVVVLVDEYDKPLLQAILNKPLLEDYRSTLKAFYSVLKSADQYLRFVFMTGVSKFSQISIFSDLNQLKDISMNADYATICGITAQELTGAFEPELRLIARANGMSLEEAITEMTKRYDGYRFHQSSTGMFNPFSVLNALHDKEFNNYWFETGTPTFLVDLLKESGYDLRLLIDGIEAPSASFKEYRAEANNPIPLFYQTGYITINNYNPNLGLYRLTFPNEEVKYGFLSFIVPYYTRVNDSENAFYIGKFIEELHNNDIPAFMQRLKAFFADIPYELNDQTERHYHAIFYLVFTLLGQKVETEVRSANGRADAVVKTRSHIYVFEFKLNGNAQQALNQIDEKGYLIPYTADGRILTKIGVDFSAEKRNINEFLIESGAS